MRLTREKVFREAMQLQERVATLLEEIEPARASLDDDTAEMVDQLERLRDVPTRLIGQNSMDFRTAEVGLAQVRGLMTDIKAAVHGLRS
jgi:hypothetical protein